MASDEVMQGPWPPLNLSHGGKDAAETCWRQYFLKTYWTWGAWYNGRNSGNPARVRAYVLKAAMSIHSEPGQVVHKAAARLVNAAVSGRQVNQDKLVAWAEKEFVQRVEKAAKRTEAKASKKAPLLLESYYGVDYDTEAGLETIRNSINALFADDHIDRVEALGRGCIVAAEDPQSFEIDVDGAVGTVWLVPDLAYQAVLSDAVGPYHEITIVDWKTGKERDSHAKQLRLYAAWAFRQPPKTTAIGTTMQRRVVSVASYLSTYTVREATPTQQEAEKEVIALRNFARKLRDRVVDGDLSRNEPLLGGEAGKKAWPQLPEGSRACGFCNYRRLCNRG